MIKSVVSSAESLVSSVARLSLAPPRLAGRMAGSVVHRLRGNDAPRTRARSSSRRAAPASRSRAKAQPRRAATRTRAKAQSKRPATRTRAKAQPKRPATRTRAKAQRKTAPRRKPLDDATIARKVESTIFRGLDVERGAVDVNVAEGVASLRGEVATPDLISELEVRATRVTEVRRVQNLLQLRKPPALSRTETPAAQAGRSAAPLGEPAITAGEKGEEAPERASALPGTNFPAAGHGPGTAPVGRAGGTTESETGHQERDGSNELVEPGVGELGKDPTHRPSDASPPDRTSD